MECKDIVRNGKGNYKIILYNKTKKNEKLNENKS